MDQLARCLTLSWHICFIEISSPKSTERDIASQGNVEHLAISFKLYELDPWISSICVVLIHEMAVFGSGSLFMHISLKLLAIVVIFTEHILRIAFSPWNYLYHRKQMDCVWSYAILGSNSIQMCHLASIGNPIVEIKNLTAVFSPQWDFLCW